MILTKFSGSARKRFRSTHGKALSKKTADGMIIQVKNFDIVASAHEDLRETISLLVHDFAILGPYEQGIGRPEAVSKRQLASSLIQFLRHLRAYEIGEVDEPETLEESHDNPPVPSSPATVASQVGMKVDSQASQLQFASQMPLSRDTPIDSTKHGIGNLDDGLTGNNISTLLRILQQKNGQEPVMAVQARAERVESHHQERSTCTRGQHQEHVLDPLDSHQQQAHVLDASIDLEEQQSVKGDPETQSALVANEASTALSRPTAIAAQEPVETNSKDQPVTSKRYDPWMNMTLERSMFLVPKDQKQILDRATSWFPAPAGRTFPRANIPIAVLRQIEEAVKVDGIDDVDDDENVATTESHPVHHVDDNGHAAEETSRIHLEAEEAAPAETVEDDGDARVAGGFDDCEDTPLPWDSSPNRRALPKSSPLPMDSDPPSYSPSPSAPKTGLPPDSSIPTPSFATRSPDLHPQCNAVLGSDDDLEMDVPQAYNSQAQPTARVEPSPETLIPSTYQAASSHKRIALEELETSPPHKRPKPQPNSLRLTQTTTPPRGQISLNEQDRQQFFENAKAAQALRAASPLAEDTNSPTDRLATSSLALPTVETPSHNFVQPRVPASQSRTATFGAEQSQPPMQSSQRSRMSQALSAKTSSTPLSHAARATPFVHSADTSSRRRCISATPCPPSTSAAASRVHSWVQSTDSTPPIEAKSAVPRSILAEGKGSRAGSTSAAPRVQTISGTQVRGLGGSPQPQMIRATPCSQSTGKIRMSSRPSLYPASSTAPLHPRSSNPSLYPRSSNVARGTQSSLNGDEAAFRRFQAAYPIYRGKLPHFRNLCRRFVKFVGTGTVSHEIPADDFVLRHHVEYMPLQQNGEKLIDYEEWYLKYNSAMRWTRRIIPMEYLEQYWGLKRTK